MKLAKLIKKSLVYIIFLFLLASCGEEEVIYKNNNNDEMIFLDINNKKINFLDYKGKFLIINYWASWCGPCVKEIPELINFSKSNKSKVNVIGVNIEQLSSQELINLINKFKINYPNFKIDLVKNLLDIDIIGFPTTYIFNQNGKLIKTIQGAVSRKTLESYIK